MVLKIDIYWDLRATLPEHHTGVGQHVIEVLNALHGCADCDVRVLIAKDQQQLWGSQSLAYGWDTLTAVVLPLTNKGNRLLYGLTSRCSLDVICAGRDLVYSPMELILSLKKIPFVNTIHGIPCFEDAVPQRLYKSPRYRWERIKQAWFLRRTQMLSAKTFPVSDYLKDQLIQRFGFKSDTLHSVYNGAADRFFEQPEPTCGRFSARPRLLSVGGANAFDGAPDLLKVARLLARDMPEASIWIAGDRHEEPWASRLRNMSNVVWHGFLSSEDMIKEMKRATALLYVPAVESFGIIGVEAMAVGLPILAKPSPPLKEVLGDAPLWVDPENGVGLLEKVQLISSDQGLRETLIQRGSEQAKCYRWSRVAERVLAGFHSVLHR